MDDVIGESTATLWLLNGTPSMALRVAEPKKGGIYIRVNKMDDGSQKAAKVLIK